jgi:hypothetical protein
MIRAGMKTDMTEVVEDEVGGLWQGEVLGNLPRELTLSALRRRYGNDEGRDI